MKVVIADASCLILLTNLNLVDTLRELYGEIWVTEAVNLEYRLPLPPFASIHDPSNGDQLDTLLKILDPGEASSIALAIETPGCRIVIDEKKGRRVALSFGLDLTGTLGVLTEAAERNLIVIDLELVGKLEEVGFHFSTDLRERFLSGS